MLTQLNGLEVEATGACCLWCCRVETLRCSQGKGRAPDLRKRRNLTYIVNCMHILLLVWAIRGPSMSYRCFISIITPEPKP